MADKPVPKPTDPVEKYIRDTYEAHGWDHPDLQSPENLPEGNRMGFNISGAFIGAGIALLICSILTLLTGMVAFMLGAVIGSLVGLLFVALWNLSIGR